MRRIAMAYDSESAMLTIDGPPGGTASIDNLATEIAVSGIPEGCVADLCYGVQVVTDQGVVYPFSRLDDNGTARIPGQVMASANAGRLPVALRLSFDDGSVQGSVNRIVLKVTVYPDPTDSAEDVWGDRLMMYGDPWIWTDEWTYSKGAAVTWGDHLYISAVDGNKGVEPGTDDSWMVVGTDGVSVTHEWRGTELVITSASGTSSADLKGEKGDKGDRGPEGPPGPDSQPGEAVVRIIGDGVRTEYDVVHNLGTTNLIISLRRGSVFVSADVSVVDPNTIRVGFTRPPAEDSVYVTIVSGGMLSRQTVYEQSEALAVWTIHHGLGRMPQVTVLDTAKNEIYGQVRHLDADTVELTWDRLCAGTAILE